MFRAGKSRRRTQSYTENLDCESKEGKVALEVARNPAFEEAGGVLHKM